MAKTKIVLPSKFTEDHWVYEKYKDKRDLDHLLGKYYISYSTSESFLDYKEDFIKQKLAGITLPDSPYSKFGNWVGESVEHGEIQANDYNFEGGENICKIERPKDAEYEKLVIIEFEEYFFLGFIDIFVPREGNKCAAFDVKTGGKLKENKYMTDEYTQLILYGKGLEQEGYEVEEIGVIFCRRENSHYKPPLKLSEEQLHIPLEYNQERVEYALERLKKNVEGVSSLYKTYLKVFGEQ